MPCLIFRLRLLLGEWYMAEGRILASCLARLRLGGAVDAGSFPVADVDRGLGAARGSLARLLRRPALA